MIDTLLSLNAEHNLTSFLLSNLVLVGKGGVSERIRGQIRKALVPRFKVCSPQTNLTRRIVNGTHVSPKSRKIISGQNIIVGTRRSEAARNIQISLT